MMVDDWFRACLPVLPERSNLNHRKPLLLFFSLSAAGPTPVKTGGCLSALLSSHLSTSAVTSSSCSYSWQVNAVTLCIL